MKRKVGLPLDKRAWHPSPLLGQIVLVTTLNEDGTSNVAPKSWISMMAFSPPLLAVGCNLKHWTAQNTLRDKEFVVNVPGSDLAEIVWMSHRIPHPRPVEAAGLTPIPSLVVAPPRIEECKAHLECRLDGHLAYGEEVVLLAQVVAVTVDRRAQETSDPYAYVQPIVYLEDDCYGVVANACQVRM